MNGKLNYMTPLKTGSIFTYAQEVPNRAEKDYIVNA
jgi:hypothetical protein